jgi:small subunit ribosomal protein S3Ae
MAEAKSKKSKTKTKTDSWKSKNWYLVKAPAIFESKDIGEIISADPENLKNRVLIVSLSSISPNASNQLVLFTNLKFRVYEVLGNVVNTKLIGHELLSSYVKSLIRRRRSLIENVEDVLTADNQKIRLKTVCISQYKLSESQKKDIRKAIAQKLKEIASSTPLDGLYLEILFGKVSAKVFNAIKKIAPIKRFEVKKSELFESF